MSGAISPLPQYALMAWWSVKAQGRLYLYRRFITVFETARCCVLSWAKWILFTSSHPVPLRSSLMSSHLPLGFPSGLFPSGLSINLFYEFPHPPACYVCRPFWSCCKYLMKSRNYEASHCVFFSILQLRFSWVHLFSCILYCQTSSICVLPLGYDRVSHLCEGADKIVILFNLLVYTEERRIQNILNWMVALVLQI